MKEQKKKEETKSTGCVHSLEWNIGLSWLLVLILLFVYFGFLRK